MADYDLALGIKPPQIDVATPLLTAAKIRAADQDAQRNQMEIRKEAIGQMARGIAPYADTPQFAEMWAKGHDSLASQGIFNNLDPATYQSLRNSPSKLGLQSLLQQTAKPELLFHQEEAKRQQANWEKEFAFKQEHENKPTFSDIGTDPNTGAPLKGFVEPTNKSVTPYSLPGSKAGTEDTSMLHGEDFLATLPANQAAQVKAMVEGRLAPPSLNRNSPMVKTLLNQGAQYEPGFDFTKWGERSRTANDFASGGKSGRNLASFNMTMQHLERLNDSIDKLGNFSTAPALNSLVNPIKGQFSTEYQKNRAQFELDKEAAIRELTTAFRGSSGNVADIIALEKKFGAADSPVALKAAVKEAVELLRGRIESVGDAYNRGMNTKLHPLSMLSPKAQSAIKKITGEEAPSGSMVGTGGETITGDSGWTDLPGGVRIREVK